MINKIKKRDVLLILGLLLVGAAIALAVYFTHSQGSYVEVWRNSELVGTYSLYNDESIDIVADDGSINQILIQAGSVCVSYADCPDQTCVNMGKISRSGQSIICLPHNLIVKVVGDDEENFDAVVR